MCVFSSPIADPCQLQEAELLAEQERREEAERKHAQQVLRAELDKFNRRTIQMRARVCTVRVLPQP